MKKNKQMLQKANINDRVDTLLIFIKLLTNIKSFIPNINCSLL